MQAMLLSEYKHLELQDLPQPVPGPDEVLVQVAACGICGSDVHGYDGSTGRRIPPIVMGHEAAGIIAAVGSAVKGFAPGDRVTFDSTVYCGACDFCRRGEFNLCDNRQVVGVSCGEFRRHGAFAEYVTVPERILYSLPSALSFAEAAMLEAVSVALHGVGVSEIKGGETALVIGAGMIGLLLLQSARAAGCSRVFVVEAVGRNETVTSAIDCVRKGGTVTLVGNITPEVTIHLQKVVSRQIRLQGSCASNGEYPQAMQLIAEGKIKVGPLITAVAPLTDGPSWFERLYSHEPNLMKIVLDPREGAAKSNESATK